MSPARRDPAKPPPKRVPFVVRREVAINRARWTPALAKLLGKVSDFEIERRSGISRNAVAAERRRRGIAAANPHREAVRWTRSMIRKLGTDSDARVAAELRVPTSAVRRKRHLLGIPPCFPPPGFEEDRSTWGAKEEALLGTASDAKVAHRIRRPLSAVSLRRMQLGVPAFRPHRARFDWTAKRIGLLGKRTDREVAEELGVLFATVKKKRLELRIPAYYEARRVVVTPELKRLLRLPTTVARNISGLKADTITELRRRLGIKAPRLSELPWTRAAIAKLGTMPDKKLARELGVSLTTVYLRRHAHGVEPYRRWRRWTKKELKLLDSNLTTNEIAGKLGRSVLVVRRRRADRRRHGG